MKITIAGSELNNLLQTVSSAIDAKPSIAWMGGILLEAHDGKLTATATCGTVTIKAEKPCEVNEQGEELIDGSMLCQFTAKLPEGIATLDSSDGKRATLKCRGSKTTLTLLDKAEFKKPDVITPKVKMVMEASKLRWMLRGAQYAIAANESRAVLTGMLFSAKKQRLVVVGLDGFRMAAYRSECEIEGEAELILHSRGAKEILKVIGKSNEPVAMESDGTKIHVLADGVDVTALLLTGDYMDYEKILPKDVATTVHVNVKEFKEAVERAMLVDDHNSLVRVKFGKEEITVQSRGSVGETVETVECSMNGEEISMAFNGKYLKECLAVIDDEEVEIRLTSALAPASVKPVGSNAYLHLVLPVRAQESEGA